MNIGWCGLGKLGLTCALVMQQRAGHEVYGYDTSPQAEWILTGQAPPPTEDHIDELLAGNQIKLVADADALVAACDVIFVAVQTPHAPAYEGVTPAPDDRRDFEYQFLVTACRSICDAANDQGKQVTMVVVSTVLPGTCNRLVRPLLGEYVTLVYGPSFIAMGTTADDFTCPEFVLLGADRQEHTASVVEAYRALHDRPIRVMSIESAELTKVAYNLQISAKIVMANTVMEICHKTGADCDDVTDALAAATDRIVSPAYMRGGMGDGGACHCRDGIAMSWLAERLQLSVDPFEFITRAREAQTGWLADLAERWSEQTGLEICVLGTAYKPGVPLQQGSAALLLRHLLEDRDPARVVWVHDPYAHPVRLPPGRAYVFVIGCKHPEFVDYEFPPGSVVLDPHGYIPDQADALVVRIGRKS